MSLDEITENYIKAIDEEIKKLTEAKNNAMKLLKKDFVIENTSSHISSTPLTGQKKRQEELRKKNISNIINLLRSSGELRTDEIAEKIGLHPNSLRKHLKQGPFESHKLGCWRLKISN